MTVGFHVEPLTLLRASARVLDLQIWASQIAASARNDFEGAAGMAGADDAGRAFATSYDPAAQSAVDTLGKIVSQLGSVANGLLRMAHNYINADVASTFGPPAPLTLPSGSCDEASQRYVLASAAGGHQSSPLPHFLEKYWPQGDPRKLQTASDNWNRLATLAETLEDECVQVGRLVSASNDGAAVDAFLGSWGTVASACRAVGEAARSLSRACAAYHDRVNHQRHKIEAILAAAGLTIAAGLAFTVITLGGSDAAAAEAVAAEMGAAAAGYAVGVEALSEVAVLSEAAAVVEEAAAAMPEVATLAVDVTAVGDVGAGLTGAESSDLTTSLFGLGALPMLFAGGRPPSGSIPGGSGPIGPVGPLPPLGTPPFPLLSAVEEAKFQEWMDELHPELPRGSNMPLAQAYQVRVAGAWEYHLVAADGVTGVNADGLRPADGAVIDAKYVQQPEEGCGMYTLNRLPSKPDFLYESILEGQTDELRRYSLVQANPGNPVRYLEIITNDQDSVAFFQQLLQELKIVGRVRYAS